MKFIRKVESVRWREFNEKYKNKLNNKTWDNFTKMSPRVDGVRVNVGSLAKSELHEYLWREQKGLCAYCMQAVPSEGFRDKSHLEHIKPRSKFRELRFDIFNIVMSCNGLNCSSEGAYTERSHCGMYKDNRNGSGMVFEEAKFISPTTTPLIEKYFFYNVNGEISCSDLGVSYSLERVNYMMSYLGLDVGYLDDYRRQVYESLVEIEFEEGVDFVEQMLSDEEELAVSFQPMMKQLFGLR